MKLSYAQWIALDYLMKPGATMWHSYGSGRIIWEDQNHERKHRVHSSTADLLRREELIEKTLSKHNPPSYGSHWKITKKGIEVHDATKPGKPDAASVKMTKFQRDLIKDALVTADPQERGIVRPWRLRDASQDFLLEQGYIERRRRYAPEPLRDEIVKRMDAAKAALVRDSWREAMKQLEEVRRATEQIEEDALFVTSKGKEEVS